MEAVQSMSQYDENAKMLLADKEQKHELQRLLGALFVEDITFKERSGVLEEFGIGLEENQKEMVKCMCNLGEGIWERGVEKGIEQERSKIASALLDVMDIPMIAKKTGLTEEEVQELAVKSNMESAFVVEGCRQA